MNSRNVKLEGLRGAAAVIVVVYHVFYTMKLGFITENDNLNKLWHYTFYLGQFGEQAVYFFLALSGYVLSNKIVNEKIASYKKWISWRFLRLIPLYYISLLFAFLVNVIALEKIPFNIQYLSLTYLFDNEIVFYNWNPPLWSLVIEIILSIPLVFMLEKFKQRSRTQQILMIIGFYALSYFSANWGIRYLLKGGAIFYAGVLASLEIKKLRYSSAALFTLVSFCVVIMEMKPIIGLKILNLSLLPIFYLYLSNLKFVNKSVSRRIGHLSKYLGRISFSLYVFHWPILIMLKKILYLGNFERGILTLMLTISLILIATVLEKYIDRPIRVKANKTLLLGY